MTRNALTRGHSAAFVAILEPIGDLLAMIEPEERAAVLDALNAAYRLGKSRAYALSGMATLSASETAALARDHAHLAAVIAGPVQ